MAGSTANAKLKAHCTKTHRDPLRQRNRARRSGQTGTPARLLRGRTCEGVKLNAAQAARNAVARAGSSGGVSHRRLERVSSAKARAPAAQLCVESQRQGAVQGLAWVSSHLLLPH